MSKEADLNQMGIRLLTSSRTELYLAMRFLGPALMSLDYLMDLSVSRVATDARFLRFHPLWVMETFMQHPYVLNRTYLHTILHCLFRHFYGLHTHPDEELWQLSSDIAVESIIDSMEEEAVRRTPSDFRTEWYAQLRSEVTVFTAEKLYAHFAAHPPDYSLLTKLLNEFAGDDHGYWKDLREQEAGGGHEARQLQGQAELWKKIAKRVESDLVTTGRKAGQIAGDLTQVLSFVLKERITYEEVLQAFTILREESRVDPDSFDYGFYHYGLELYGNMPLIEENEFAESERIRQLVIVVDTSASISDETLRRFLSETAGVLKRRERFFQQFELHLLMCDAAVQADRVITDAGTLLQCAEGIEIHGGGGTDFRPAFSYVEELQRQGELRDLSGLIYFTDGYGRYPAEAPSYETAFVYAAEDPPQEKEIPSWVIRVELT